MFDRSATFNRRLDELLDLEIFVEICKEGMHAGVEAVDFVHHIREAKLLLNKPDPYPTADALRSAKYRAEQMQEVARREVPAGFPYLHGLAAIRVWGILEIAVDGYIEERLSDVQQWRRFPVLRQIKGPLIEFAESPKERQAEYLLDQLKGITGAKLRPGVGRFEAILEAVGLSGGVNDVVRRNILELAEVRNLVAHRGWEVDQQFAERCPWLDVAVSDRLVITPTYFARYHGSGMWYLIELELRRGASEKAGNGLSEDSVRRLLDLQSNCLERVVCAAAHGAKKDA